MKNPDTWVDRVNFATSHIGNKSNPGVKTLIERVGIEHKTPSKLVHDCLDVLGCVEIETDTYQKLEEVAAFGLKNSNSSEGISSSLVIELFKLIVSSREYQRC